MLKLARIKKRIKEDGLDGILITGETNIFYLTGFPGKDMMLLVTAKGDDYYFTDARLYGAAQERIGKMYKSVLIRRLDSKRLKDIFKKENISRIGFEAKYVSFYLYEKLRLALKSVKLVPTSAIIERVRAIKSEQEIAHVKKAARLTRNLFRCIREDIKPGITERRISNKLDIMMRQSGATNSFESIVASGLRSAWPHATVSDKKIKADDIVLLDFGAKINGYCSDFTRVIFTGLKNERLANLLRVVKAAQNLALKLIRPGKMISSVVKKVNYSMEEAGFGKFILHGLGHGLGLEVHETPNLSTYNNSFFKKGLIFTVEPGLYIPNLGGVRIEDLVCLNENGPEVLT